MTATERFNRLERALAELTRSHTANYPLRGRGPGVEALKEIESEIAQLDEAAAAALRRGALESELAALGSA